MAISLILDVAESVLDEQGYSLMHLAREQWDELDAEGVYYEPVSRAVMLEPELSAQETRLCQWTTWGGSFEEVTPPELGVTAIHQKQVQADTYAYAESQERIARNGSFVLWLFLRQPPAWQMEEHRADVYFGGRYRLTLRPGEDAELWRAAGLVWSEGKEPPVEYGTAQFAKVAEGRLFADAEEFYGRWHRIWILPVKRDGIVIQGDHGLGFCYREEDVLSVEEEGGRKNYVTFAARVRIRVLGGMFVFALGRPSYATSGTLASPTICLPYTATAEPKTEVRWELREGCTVGLEVLAEKDGGAFEPPADKFAYRLTLSGPGDETPMVYEARVEFDPTTRERSPQAVDCSNYVLYVREVRSADRQSARMEFTVDNTGGTFDEKRERANLRVTLDVDGKRRFTGLTGRTVTKEGNAETVTFVCSDLWKRLEAARLSNASCFDGEVHTEVVKRLCKLAGIREEEMVVAEDEYRLPEAEGDEEPLFLPRNGETVASFLSYIAESFSGWRLGFDEEGKFHYEPWPEEEPQKTFVTKHPAGEGELVVFARESEVDESGHANEIWVIGRSDSGKLLSAYYVDYSSMHDPTYRYYVGERRLLIWVDTALNSQAAVNWVCRTLAEEAAKFKHYARVEAEFDAEVGPGDRVTMDGLEYVVRTVDAVLLPKRRRAEYVLERVEEES